MNNPRRNELENILKLLESAKDRLEAVLDEEEGCRDSTPESFQGTERYEISEAVCDNLTEAVDSLDNAIEAARQCAHGSVHAAMHAQEHFLVMEVENTCINTQAANGKVKHILPASTKPDAENHGFGIANVRDTAQKYGGLLYIEQNGNHFTAILTIAKSCLARYNGTVEK